MLTIVDLGKKHYYSSSLSMDFESFQKYKFRGKEEISPCWNVYWLGAYLFASTLKQKRPSTWSEGEQISHTLKLCPNFLYVKLELIEGDLWVLI